MIRVAIFTDNDFDKVNGVTTTLKAVLRHVPDDVAARVYTESSVPTDRADYCALKSVGVGLPWYREMRVYWPRLRALQRHLAQDGADVIHITTPGPLGLAARAIAGRLDLPTTGSFHTNLGDYVATYSGLAALGHAVDRYMRWVYRGCDPVLVPSTSVRQALERCGYPSDRLALWSRGVDTNQFSPARRAEAKRRLWGVHDGRPAILYAGRLSLEKGLGILPAVQRQLDSWEMPHRLILVGDGPMAAELRGACPDAIFLGTQPHDEVAVAMASADAFIFPSATDTLGNVILEAQACGLPVVVSDRGGPREHIHDGETGLIAQAGNAADFAHRIAAILRQSGIRKAMGREARALALTRSWPDSLAPLVRAWRRAARRRAAVHRRFGGPDAVHVE